MAATVTRQLLLGRVVAALEAQPAVHAVWLEGADAAGRADACSDLDLWADVDAGYEAQVFTCIHAALLSLGLLDVEHDASHPHPQLEQRFYRVAGTSPFWFVDVCLQQHGRETVLTGVNTELSSTSLLPMEFMSPLRTASSPRSRTYCLLRRFVLPKRQELQATEHELVVVVVDSTETSIERPKKTAPLLQRRLGQSGTYLGLKAAPTGLGCFRACPQEKAPYAKDPNGH